MTLIAITPGEPAGIGPDILIKLVQYDLPIPLCIIADRDLLKNRADMIGLPLPQNLSIQHVPLRKSCIAGKPDPVNAEYVLETLKIAVKGCQSGDFKAMVTGPVSKYLINEAGISFIGHTEWLATITGAKQTVMLFVADDLKVALYTTHIPLSQVSSSLNSSTLRNCIQILHDGLRKYFSIKNPNIIVCGLNPHAGEEGYLGKEEITTIRPVIEALKEEGLQLKGPLPADTAFIPTYIKASDAVLALYHDQGLPLIKAISFSHAVNVTLGLPFIRTSVDHGTAFDLAGTDLADEQSLLTAVKLASKISCPSSLSWKEG